MMDMFSIQVTFSALLCILVDGEIITTPKQNVAWSQKIYTLLTSAGYIPAVSPFMFEVKTCKNAHVGLMELNDQGDPGRIYEIVIGGWSNTKSVLRSVKQQVPPEVYHMESFLLNCNEFRPFQITWDNFGSVKVFKYINDSSLDCLLSWTDPTPFIVKYIGVTTGVGGDGFWNISVPGYTTTSQTIPSTASRSTTTINTDTTTMITTSTSITTTAAATTTTPSSPETTMSTNTNSPSTHLTTGPSIPSTGNQTTYTTSTLDPNSSESTTLCPCSCVTLNRTYTQEQLEEEIQKLRTDLLVVKSKTSKSIRSKISAKDSRTSSTVMGVAAGVILTVIFGGIILLDIPNLIVMIKDIRRSVS